MKYSAGPVPDAFLLPTAAAVQALVTVDRMEPLWRWFLKSYWTVLNAPLSLPLFGETMKLILGV